MKWIENIIKILSINAMLFVVSILTFYFHASKIIDHLPSYNNPDPKQLNIYENYSLIINFTIGLWFFSFIICLILLIFLWVKTRNNANYRLIVSAIVLQCIPIVIISSDIFKWYID